jgi:hypothetical protein
VNFCARCRMLISPGTPVVEVRVATAYTEGRIVTDPAPFGQPNAMHVVCPGAPQ